MNKLNKSLKTPLRYPGGKSRAVTKMAQYFPDFVNYAEFREPFLGGGSVAIHVSQMYPHLKIWVNDLYEPLVNFWMNLQMFGVEMMDILLDYKKTHPDHTTAKELFLNSKEIINDKGKSNLDRAVAFYIVNKCSFSGLTESSSFSKQASDSNFSVRGIVQRRLSMLKENPTLIVPLLFILLTSALFLVSLSPHPSPNKPQTATSLFVE